MSKLKREQCAAFNDWRDKSVGKILSAQTVYDALDRVFERKIGHSIITFLTKGVNPPIERIERGKYRVNYKPVHISVLESCFKELSKRQQLSNRRWKVKQGIKSIPSTKVTIKAPVPEEKSLEERIQDAIKLLKENGYQVRKIKIEYEEV